MKLAAPTVRDLARRLMAQEAGECEPSETQAHAAFRVCEKLRLHLSKLVGAAGFQCLLARALALARAEVLWLEAVQVKTNGSLEGLDLGETAQKRAADETARGGVALLVHLLGLLVTFIGEALTLRLVRDIWPDAPLDEPNLGAEERPQ